MNLFEMALAQSRANPSVASAEDRYEQLRIRYNQLVEDYKNLQKTVQHLDGKIYELRECLNAVLDDSLVTGMKSWKDKTFKALEESK